MTKAQLLHILEPFDDETDIVGLVREHYLCEPRLFYYMGIPGSAAQIILVTDTLPHGKAVELKV